MNAVAQARRLLVRAASHRVAELLFQFAVRRAAERPAHGGVRRAFVQQIDRLVRQIFVREVAAGELDRRADRRLGDDDPVVRLQRGPKTLQDLLRLLAARLADLHRPEAALQRGVLFDAFAIFGQGRRADELHLAASEGGLKQVGRVDRALRRACAGQRVHFVDEQDHVLHAAHLRQNVADALLELAAVLRAGDEARHVQREQALAAQRLRHAACGDLLRDPFDDGGLADARLADQRGIVLLPARQDLQDRLDLALSADDELRLIGAFRQIDAELVQQAGVLHSGKLLLSGAGALVQIGKEKRGADAAPREQEGRAAPAVAQDRGQHGLRAKRTVLAGGAGDRAAGARGQSLRKTAQPSAAPAQTQELPGQLLRRQPLPLQFAAGVTLRAQGDPDQNVLRADAAVAEHAGDAPRLFQHLPHLPVLLSHAPSPPSGRVLPPARRFIPAKIFLISDNFHCFFQKT